MGILVDGVWQQEEGHIRDVGAVLAKGSPYRSWITKDGSPGPSGVGGFKAEPGRYHLYVSYGCPFAHRTLIMRHLKGLENMISISATNPYMRENGWTFEDGPRVIPDTVCGAKYLHQVYTKADPKFTGRVSVPVLWDKQTNTIVNNESAEIIRMFNEAFDELGAKPVDYYPPQLRSQIDEINDRILKTVNSGVYKAGFATQQDKYREAVHELFSSLDWLDSLLAKQRYLVGGRLTEADIRLFVTMIRFDAAYHGHFKCNLRRLSDYPHLWAYTRDILQTAAIAETVDIDYIKTHYYGSHRHINPTGIVPAGPVLDLTTPHGRDALP